MIIFLAVVTYLFSLIYIESELVKLERKKESLRNRLITLKNQKKQLEFEVADESNLAKIETEAKAQGYIFPKKEDILGEVR